VAALSAGRRLGPVAGGAERGKVEKKNASHNNLFDTKNERGLKMAEIELERGALVSVDLKNALVNPQERGFRANSNKRNGDLNLFPNAMQKGESSKERRKVGGVRFPPKRVKKGYF